MLEELAGKEPVAVEARAAQPRLLGREPLHDVGVANARDQRRHRTRKLLFEILGDRGFGVAGRARPLRAHLCKVVEQPIERHVDVGWVHAGQDAEPLGEPTVCELAIRSFEVMQFLFPAIFFMPWFQNLEVRGFEPLASSLRTKRSTN